LEGVSSPLWIEAALVRMRLPVGGSCRMDGNEACGEPRVEPTLYDKPIETGQDGESLVGGGMGEWSQALLARERCGCPQGREMGNDCRVAEQLVPLLAQEVPEAGEAIGVGPEGWRRVCSHAKCCNQASMSGSIGGSWPARCVS
jgi:hypothetical protein